MRTPRSGIRRSVPAWRSGASPLIRSGWQGCRACGNRGRAQGYQGAAALVPVDLDEHGDADVDPLFAALPSGLDPLDLLEQLATLRPTWWVRAACRDVGVDDFFVDRGADSRPARELCRSCAVIDRCSEAGLYERHGIWGGTSHREREQGRRAA